MTKEELKRITRDARLRLYIRESGLNDVTIHMVLGELVDFCDITPTEYGWRADVSSQEGSFSSSKLCLIKDILGVDEVVVACSTGDCYSGEFEPGYLHLEIRKSKA